MTEAVKTDVPSDAALMAGVARGDGAMLGELYRRYGHTVRMAIWRWFPQNASADADDLVQDIFLALGASAKTYREQERFKAWLFTIAFRKATDMTRAASRRGKDMERRRLDEANSPGWNAAVSHETRSEMRVAVRQMLDLLPHESREVLLLHVVDGFTAAEIGRITGVDETTARTRLHRARKRVLEHTESSKWKLLLEGGA